MSAAPPKLETARDMRILREAVILPFLSQGFRRHHPITETTDHRWHDCEEDHDQARALTNILKTSGSPMICMPGYINSARIPSDMTPPTSQPKMAKIKYIVPMSLWLVA